MWKNRDPLIFSDKTEIFYMYGIQFNLNPSKGNIRTDYRTELKSFSKASQFSKVSHNL
jgi:NADH:ubiquinone oxidoreductase subunit C